MRGPHLKHSGSIYGDGVPGGTGETGFKFIFLVKDGFTTAEAAPIATPRTGEIGHWLVTQAAGDNFAIVGGSLIKNLYSNYQLSALTASSSVGVQYTVPRLGAAMYIRNATRAPGYVMSGFSTLPINPAGIQASPQGGFGIYNGQAWGGAVTMSPFVWSDSDSVIVIGRTYGGYLFKADGTLLWVWELGAVTPLYPIVGSAGAGTIANRVNVARLPGLSTDTAPGNGFEEFSARDLGIMYFSAAPVVTIIFTATPDFVATYKLANPITVNRFFNFRRTDANNTWFVMTTPGGDLYLYEDIAAVVTLRGTSTYTAGATIGVVANGETIKVYADGVLKISYSGASPWTSVNGFAVAGTTEITNVEVRTLNGIANVGSVNHPGYGIATGVLPGPLAVNNQAARELTLWGEVRVPAIPTVGNIEYAIRYVDANNYVYLQIDTAGNFDLRSVTGGAGSVSLATNAAGLAGTERVVIVDDGATIKIYNTTVALPNTPVLAISHATTAHNTAQLTRCLSLGTSGQLAKAVNRPLNINNTNNTPGAIHASKGINFMSTGV